jgi:carbon monoxide dehydrogenase subunit G
MCLTTNLQSEHAVALTIHSAFDIEAPQAMAWAILTDIERAAPCFPGAQLQGRNDDGSWRASFGVKLGPMAFSFAGTFNLSVADEAAGHAVVKAQGSDTKGRGGASATVDVQLSQQGSGTRVEIVSAVDLSGSVAQFGRGAGMIEALSRQLVNQFAVNLRQAIAAQGGASGGSAPAGPAASAAAPSPAPAACATSALAPTSKPLNAGVLVWQALLAVVKGWFAPLFSRK